MQKPRTTLEYSVHLQPDMEQWLAGLERYGVPAIDEDEPPWPGEWEQVTKEGSLFNRIEKWMFKEHNIKLYSHDKATLSNSLAHALIHKGLEVEVNNDFLWNPGDYGDVKSCFFGGKRQAWPFLHKMGGMAMKVYNKDKGVARCLMLPYQDGTPILFNSFGYPLTHMLAIYLATFDPQGDQRFTLLNLSVSEDSRKPIHFNEFGVLMADAQASHYDFDGSQYYNQTYGRYHLFCEMCYTRLVWSPKAAHGNGLHKHSAHLCETCIADRELSGKRWEGVSLVVHEAFEGEGDEDQGRGTASHPRFSMEPDGRGRNLDMQAIYSSAFLDEAARWQGDLLYGTPDLEKRRSLCNRLVNDGVTVSRLVPTLIDIIRYAAPGENRTELEALRQTIAFSEVLGLVQMARMVGVGSKLTGMVRVCLTPSEATPEGWIRLAYASKHWDGSRTGVRPLLEESLGECMMPFVYEMEMRWSYAERVAWGNLPYENRMEIVYHFVRDGVDNFSGRAQDLEEAEAEGLEL
jgi:hypothetical protein